MSPFQSKKAIWYSIGAAFIFLSVFLYAVFMPGLATPLGTDAPDVRVPNMRNVPGPEAPLQLETAEPVGRGESTEAR